MPHIDYDKRRFGLYIAQALKAKVNSEVAVLIKNGTSAQNAPSIVGVGVHPADLPAWSTHTAIVNAIQGVEGSLGNITACCTYQPTVACLGMMKTHQMTSAVFWDPPNIQENAIKSAKWADVIQSKALVAKKDFQIRGDANELSKYINLNEAPSFDNLERMATSANAVIQDWRNSWQTWKVSGNHSKARKIGTLQRHVGNGGGFTQGFVDTVYILFAYTIAARVWNAGGALTVRGAKIVAVLGNLQGTIYGWQVNARGIGTTFHAETNLVQGTGKIPDDATLYTTLEPCHQCAGLFVKATGTRCVYGMEDPNIKGNTELGRLDRASLFQRRTYQMYRDQTAQSISARLIQIQEELDERRALDLVMLSQSQSVFEQSQRVLTALIGIVRGQYATGHPKRTFIENFATALALPPALDTQ